MVVHQLHDQKTLSFSFRVKTVRKPDHILSVLTIKSAILKDAGNYSCLLPETNHSDTVRLTIIDGERETKVSIKLG